MEKKKNLIIGTIIIVCVVLIGILYVIFSDEKIDPGVIKDASASSYQPTNVVSASIENVTQYYEAVGTVRPRIETNIQAQVTAQVIEVKVNPSDKVVKDQVLIILDNKPFISRLDQAREGFNAATSRRHQAEQGLKAAEAGFAQAEAAYNRTKNYFKSQAATSQDLERAETGYLQADAAVKQAKSFVGSSDAGIRQAQEIINEAQISLNYTTIRAPESGEVLKRLVEPGDLALPGKPLLMLQNSGSLRLEASVREGLITKVKPKTSLQVKIDTLNITLTASVEEIVPYADPQTRTFLVKAVLPATPDIYPGMFGKLLIPLEEVKEILIPKAAVKHVGQLELVNVKEKQGWKTRFITTGKIYENKIEVLSGLSGNEEIGY
ncbi:MAG: efflux RND transporter periplasmic adaptor subunit [Desulfobacterales bacterium]|nr:efflux RND transporter periplasmic adaptor subunit [Desulfobacterales bacterium]